MLASTSKHKLSTLMGHLRLSRIAVTESEIVDTLVIATSAEPLSRNLKK
jgi:hypothetical protein